MPTRAGDVPRGPLEPGGRRRSPYYACLVFVTLAAGLLGLLYVVWGPSPISLLGTEPDSNRSATSSAAASPPAQVPPDARGEGSPARMVKVMSAQTRAPIAGAEVRVQTTHSIISYETDLSGRAVPSQAGTRLVSVRARGHVGLDSAQIIPDEGLIVALERTGGIRLTFLDEEDRGVAGIRAALLTPTEDTAARAQGWRSWIARHPNLGAADPADPLHAPFQTLALPPPRHHTSREDGTVLWEELPPAAGYRWAFASPGAVDILPPFEEPIASSTAEGFRTTSNVPKDLSGAISLNPGEQLSFRIRVYANTGVTGRVIRSGRRPVPDATVKIFSRKDYTNTLGGRLVLYDLEAHAFTDADGHFRLTGIKPGEKQATVLWQQSEESGIHVYMSLLDWRAQSGRVHEIGDVRDPVGSTLTGTIRLECVGFSPNEFRQANWTPRALVTVDASPANRAVDPAHSHLFELPVETLFHLHGLPEGEVRVLAESAADAPAISGMSWDPPKRLLVKIPSPAAIDLLLRARRLCKLGVEIGFPAGVAPFPCSLFALARGGGVGTRVRWEPASLSPGSQGAPR